MDSARCNSHMQVLRLAFSEPAQQHGSVWLMSLPQTCDPTRQFSDSVHSGQMFAACARSEAKVIDRNLRCGCVLLALTLSAPPLRSQPLLSRCRQEREGSREARFGKAQSPKI